MAHPGHRDEARGEPGAAALLAASFPSGVSHGGQCGGRVSRRARVSLQSTCLKRVVTEPGASACLLVNNFASRQHASHVLFLILPCMRIHQPLWITRQQLQHHLLWRNSHKEVTQGH